MQLDGQGRAGAQQRIGAEGVQQLVAQCAVVVDGAVEQLAPPDNRGLGRRACGSERFPA